MVGGPPSRFPVFSNFPSSLRPLAASLRPFPTSLRPKSADEPAPAPKKKKVQFLLKVAAVCAAAYALTAVVSVDASSRVTPTVVSGKAGVRSGPSGQPQQWHKQRVSVVLDPSLDDVGPDAKDAVRDAIGTWLDSGGKLPKISFDNAKKAGKAAKDGVNRVLVGPITMPGHEKDVAVTIGYVDDRTGLIVEADIIFNERYAFAGDSPHDETCDGHYDLANVATHEAGHFFGLGEDMSDPDTVMYFRSAPCETRKRALSDADREVISSIYTEEVDVDESTESSKASGCSSK